MLCVQSKKLKCALRIFGICKHAAHLAIRNMSEKYVKEILEKLEEIEKLHAKLRRLVPRVKNHEPENPSLNAASRRRSTNMGNKQPVARETIKMDLPEQKPIGFRRDSGFLKNAFKTSTTRMKKLFDTNARSTKHLRKFHRESQNKWGRFKRNSIDFITTQWQDKNDRIRDFWSSISEPDVILGNGLLSLGLLPFIVTRASQTSETDIKKLASRSPSLFTPELEKRRSTPTNLSRRLKKRFSFSRDPSPKESTVMVHHNLSESEPHKVRKTSFVPDEKSETLKIVSSARRISVDG
ncbi:uncharacterized protein LOC113464525 [Ceratina calcarata]|uniref:Uncharacterized protein LOC113464525 n=1 Tax=Ceratina calcarata TaxID=156304 RepID=A0AAJ7S331_9HYME|nr:uncharacterized protein LOC113464525 [Ceratina calcarata]